MELSERDQIFHDLSNLVQTLRSATSVARRDMERAGSCLDIVDASAGRIEDLLHQLRQDAAQGGSPSDRG